MITRIVTIWRCYYVIAYIPYAVQYIPVTYFITGSLYLLIPFTYFTHSTASCIGNHQFVPCVYESVPVLFFVRLFFKFHM